MPGSSPGRQRRFRAETGVRARAALSPKGLLSIVFGKNDIDLGAAEQLVDMSQTRAMGEAIYYATRYMDNKRTLKDVIDRVMSDLDKSGLDV